MKYGVTRDWVLGLEVVLADGAVIRTGGKNSQGRRGLRPDRHLFVGSEGTLGMITEATLRLLPDAAAEADHARVLRHASLAAGEAVAGITAAGVVPVTLELMDAFTIPPSMTRFQLGLDRTPAAMLMIESDAGGAAAEAELAAAETACEAAGATSVLRARPTRRRPTGCARLDAGALAHWSRRAWRAWTTWACRAAASPEMLDRDRAHRRGRRACRSASSAMPVTATSTRRTSMDRDDPDGRAAHRRGARRDLQGSAGARRHRHRRARHRRGQARYLELQRGDAGVALTMRAIKHALDPQGILNPGKVV